MKLTTTVIEIVEMTQQEENELWDASPTERKVCGKAVLQWNVSDGQNWMRLEGENFGREVYIRD